MSETALGGCAWRPTQGEKCVALMVPGVSIRLIASHLSDSGALETPTLFLKDLLGDIPHPNLFQFLKDIGPLRGTSSLGVTGFTTPRYPSVCSPFEF
ncbi:hypothetical protein AVEN_183217-1 [Araneus ventricosus]|uniref:Uncharacterized protein n=1 Tax=Araneus ventricosus TaxID=182803 RepID=A0A4Y2KSG1_ARAVE|nr:hypothetical protein AVEN_183217-1 [Araneus ventricosus]